MKTAIIKNGEIHLPYIAFNICTSCLLAKLSYCLQPFGQQPASLLRSQDFSGKNIGAGCHSPLQGTFLTQGQNPCILHGKWVLSPLSHQESSYASRRFLFHYYGNCLPNRGKSTNFRKDFLLLFISTIYEKEFLFMDFC